jgi:hypothetical protein
MVLLVEFQALRNVERGHRRLGVPLEGFITAQLVGIASGICVQQQQAVGQGACPVTVCGAAPSYGCIALFRHCVCIRCGPHGQPAVGWRNPNCDGAKYWHRSVGPLSAEVLCGG